VCVWTFGLSIALGHFLSFPLLLFFLLLFLVFVLVESKDFFFTFFFFIDGRIDMRDACAWRIIQAPFPNWFLFFIFFDELIGREQGLVSFFYIGICRWTEGKQKTKNKNFK
jgi:hypothetical protein